MQAGLVNTTQVAEILRITRQRVYQLRRKEDFPKPLTMIRGNAQWDYNDIVVYKLNRNDKPGRPAKTEQAKAEKTIKKIQTAVATRNGIVNPMPYPAGNYYENGEPNTYIGMNGR